MDHPNDGMSCGERPKKKRRKTRKKLPSPLSRTTAESTAITMENNTSDAQTFKKPPPRMALQPSMISAARNSTNIMTAPSRDARVSGNPTASTNKLTAATTPANSDDAAACSDANNKSMMQDGHLPDKGLVHVKVTIAHAQNITNPKQQTQRHHHERQSFEDYRVSPPAPNDGDDDDSEDSAISDPLVEAVAEYEYLNGIDREIQQLEEQHWAMHASQEASDPSGEALAEVQYLNDIGREIQLLEEQHWAKDDTELGRHRREEQELLLEIELDISGQEMHAKNSNESQLPHRPEYHEPQCHQENECKHSQQRTRPREDQPSEPRYRKQSLHHQLQRQQQQPLSTSLQNPEPGLKSAHERHNDGYSDHQDKSSSTIPAKQLTQMVRTALLVPKFHDNYKGIGGEGSKAPPILTPYIIQTQIEMPFRVNDIPKLLGTCDDDHFSSKLNELSGNPYEYRLCMEGPKILVDAFRIRLEKWINTTLVAANFEALLADVRRCELNATVPLEQFLEAWEKGCFQVVSSINQSGLLVDLSAQRKGDDAIEILRHLLGHQAMQCELMVAVTRIEGSEYNSDTREQVGQMLQKVSEPEMNVTIVVSGGVDLHGINTDVMTRGRRSEEGALVPTEIDVSSDMDLSSLNLSVSTIPTARESEGNQDAVPKNGRKNESMLALGQFKKKYKAINDIEYKDNDVTYMYQFVTSEMWKQHKRLFGSTACGDNCECGFYIRDMTEHVVENFIAKRIKEDPTWVPPSSSTDGVGFVNRFGGWSFIRAKY
jgi:hypothetical protein